MDYNKLFKTHVAKLTDYDTIQILEFKIPNMITYGIKYSFDKDGKILTISGDFGVYVVRGFATPKKLYDIIINGRNIENPNIQYFAEKIVCSDHDIYYYDLDECMAHLFDVIPEISDKRKLEDIKDALTDELDERTPKDCNKIAIRKILSDYSPLDSYELYSHIDDMPVKIHQNVDIILTGFKFAWEQIHPEDKAYEERHK